MNGMFEFNLLLDFYGQLLTNRQQEIFDLHYNNDYSLGEIAEQMGISRQGVYDNIKRGRTSLVGFEEKLGLVGKFLSQKKRAQQVLKKLTQIKDYPLENGASEALDEIQQLIEEIIQESN